MADMNDILNPPKVEEPEEVEAEVQEAVEEKPVAEERAVEEQKGAAQPDAEQIRTELRAEMEKESAKEKSALAKERERVRQKELALEEERAKLVPKEDDAQTFWDNPEQVLSGVQSKLKTEFQEAIVNERVNTSVVIAQGRYADFQEKVDIFNQLVQEKPDLYFEMRKQPNPAEFAYRTAMEHKEREEMGDPATYKANLREQLKAELSAEYEAKLKEAEDKLKDKETQEAEALVKKKLEKGGFSEVRSVGRNAEGKFSGPTPMKSIIGK